MNGLTNVDYSLYRSLADREDNSGRSFLKPVQGNDSCAERLEQLNGDMNNCSCY